MSYRADPSDTGMNVCPHCGYTLPGPEWDDERRALTTDGTRRYFGRQAWLILAALRSRPAEMLTKIDLMRAAYRDPYERGESSIYVHIHYLREKLKGSRYRIVRRNVSEGGPGYCLERTG